MSKISLDEKSTDCPICGSNSIKLFKARAFDAGPTDRVNIRECKCCHFAWQFPRGRTTSESADWFEKSYADKSHAKSEYFDESRKREISQLEIGFVASLKTKGHSLLDIGAGSGTFAEVAAENGWNVTAVDPALNCDRLNKCESINAIKGSLCDVPRGQLFDVITLWDVIEHVDTPLELISSAKKYLKNGGWLVIETGNYKCVDRIKAGASHWIYQLDHRWYFSPESIEKLLTECGFDDIVICDKALRPGWEGLASYAGPSRAIMLKSIATNPLHLTSLVSEHLSLVKAKNWGNAGIPIFTLAARKT